MTNRLPDNIPDLLNLISHVYDYRINECGPVANGVFWSTSDRQTLSYEILLKAVAPEDLNGPITVNDFGCGYGALFDLLASTPMMNEGRYVGYDISEKMITAAKKRHYDPRAAFITSPIASDEADYSFVSGTYNMSMGAGRALWTHYVKTSLKMLWNMSKKAMAFNILDNKGKKKLPDLYYADKSEFVAFAKTLSPDIEVIDDYNPSEFTIIVRRPTV